jgi:hypothetical protein
MMKYMVTVRLTPHNEQEQSHIDSAKPMERPHLEDLIKQGMLDAVYISHDGTVLWGVMPGDSLDQIKRELSNCAVSPYMKADYVPLMA